MKSTEDKNQRQEMVGMHQFFIDKIDNALKNKWYIEASWLIYACMENRFFRVLHKYKKQCKYCKGKCNKNKNELAISTKINCVKRLCESNVTCISNSFTIDQLDEIRKWVKKRNNLIHDLLTLESYQDSDEAFKELALEGQNLCHELYESCTNFRKLYFDKEYTFEFPEKAMEDCSCAKTRKNNTEE